jgi:hypothetical protein
MTTVAIGEWHKDVLDNYWSSETKTFILTTGLTYTYGTTAAQAIAAEISSAGYSRVNFTPGTATINASNTTFANQTIAFSNLGGTAFTYDGVALISDIAGTPKLVRGTNMGTVVSVGAGQSARIPVTGLGMQ